MTANTGAAELLTACHTWKRGDLDGFASIVRGALSVLGMLQRDLADEFDVSIATISRWASAEAKPHAIVQESVVDFVRRRAMRATASAARTSTRAAG